MDKTIKLTSEMLEDMIEKELLEYRAEHCKGKPLKDKMDCEKRDRESRERSADRRRKQEMYGTIPSDLKRYQKGILEGENEDGSGSDKIVLDKSAFDLLMKRLASEYENHLSNDLTLEQTDQKKAKVIALCNRYGLKSFRSFLNIINAWELASSGKLHKTEK